MWCESVGLTRRITRRRIATASRSPAQRLATQLAQVATRGSSSRQLRVQGGSDLRPGTIENISQSGLFLRIEDCPAKDEVLELIFEMPIEISGQHNAKVLCIGRVVRIAPPTEEASQSGCAVTILDYHFLHDEERKKAQPARRPRNNSGH